MDIFNLKNKKILKVFNIAEHDHDFFNFYNELSYLKKDFFEPNEKIIILHNDTEYFYHESKIGFSMHNLLTCIKDIDIPMHVVVILTNHYGYEKSIIDFLGDTDDLPTVVFNYINNSSFLGLSDVLKSKDKEKNIKHFGIGLWGGTARAHRSSLVKWLLYNQLDKKILISYNISYDNLSGLSNQFTKKIKTIKRKNVKSYGNIDFVTANQHRIDETFENSLFRTIPKNSNINSQWTNTPLNPIKNEFLSNGSLEDVYSSCFIDIVSETTFMYPYPFFSEKTIRPIFLKTPFLIFGPAGMLNCLHNFGFKTFSDFWDESYDKMENHWERFEKICLLIKKLSKISHCDLEIMYSKMESTLNHNRNLLDEYITNTYYPLYNEIEKHV